MKKMKKILSLMLILIMCFSVVPMTDLGIEAEAASGVQAKLDAIKSVYPAGSYFTVSGGLYAYDKGTGCQLSNIPARGGLSSGAVAKNVMGEAWSCCGFARYVFYNIFGTGSMSQVSLSNAKIGDYVVFNGHYGIYLSHDSTYVYVYDSNFTTSSTNRVGYNTRVPISRFSAVYRANNYSDIDGSSTPTDPNAIQYHDHSIEDISTKDARIKMWISNPSGKTIWSTGFFFGTDPDNLNLYVVNTKINWTDFCADYTISNYCGELSPGVKYYYRFYVVEEENFNYSQSDLYSFTTYGTSNVRYDHIETTAVSSLDANISAWAWNDVGYTISSYGFCLGESPTTMKKYQVYSNIAWTNFHTQVDVANYTGVLTPGKTYYYRFYAVIDTNYYSDVYSFTTDSTLPTFTVTFNANGGSCSTTSKTVTYSNTYGTLPTPTQSGYTFNGWYTSASGGSKITSDTVMKEIGNHTLYAHWTCTHSSTEVRNAKSATCTATGYTGDTYCKTCGTKLKTGITISKTSHNSNTTIPAVDATCTSTGLTEGKKCSVCGTVTVAQQTVAKKTHSYTATVTTQPTCTKDGVRTYKCSCGTTYTEAIAKTGHNSNTTIPAIAATCTKSGLTEGKKCSVCGTVTLAQQTIAAKGHTDGNGDYKCDYNCGYEYEKTAEPEVPSDPSENCSCNCHKGGIAGFFFRIINFFQKLFGMNKICECGAKH